jgi:hypothetical protein
VVTHLPFRVPNHDLPCLVMSSNSQPRWPILMHSPMWLNAFSFFNRIMLFVRLSLIHGEYLLATRAQSTCSYWSPLIPLPLPMAEPQMHDPSPMHTRIRLHSSKACTSSISAKIQCPVYGLITQF